MKLQEHQYDALCDLMRIGKSPSSEAARMVLVHGAKIKDAAQAVGLKYRGAAAAVQRMKEGIAMAKVVAE